MEIDMQTTVWLAAVAACAVVFFFGLFLVHRLKEQLPNEQTAQEGAPKKETTMQGDLSRGLADTIRASANLREPATKKEDALVLPSAKDMYLYSHLFQGDFRSLGVEKRSKQHNYPIFYIWMCGGKRGEYNIMEMLKQKKSTPAAAPYAAKRPANMEEATREA